MRNKIPRRIFFTFFLSTCLLQTNLFSQTVQLIANPGQSANIVVGPNNYHVSESIYTEAEIGSANFTSGATAINHIDFSVFVVGAPTLVTNFKIYLKEVPLTTSTLAIGVYNTTGYTLVYDGSIDFNATGWIGVDLTTPFTRSSGNNLQLLIERLDGATHGAFSFNATRGNETGSGILSSRRENPAVQPVPGTTSLNTVSAFRPRIQLKHTNPNDARLTQVYTLGKLPIPFATPHIISANILNNGTNTLTNLAVTLNVTGANTFTDVKTIASLAPGASTDVLFNAFSPTTTGTNTVAVTIPADGFPGDNALSVTQEITNNSYNYAYGNVATGFVGVTGNTVDFVAKFTTSSPTSVNQAGVRFGGGGQPFRIGIWDKSGTGLPGALLWESTDQVSTTGLFTLPISPAVAVTDTFFVGVMQIGLSNVQFAYQSESPARPNTFYFSQPGGSNTWTDFAANNTFRFMIEPRLTVANDVGIATINNPVAATSIDNCGIVPQVTVANFGSNDQVAPFNVTYQIRQSGATVFTDTKSLSLNSGGSQKVYFAPFTGSVTGSDSSIVYTSLASDAARNNDTVVNTFTTNNFSYGGGSPSNGGYLFANSTSCASPSSFQPTYNWVIEQSNEVNWGANGDDSIFATPITLPFAFNFFGNAYTQFWICSNGWITFSDPAIIPVTAAQQRTPVTIPLAGGIENYIAGILNDLDNTAADYPDAHTYYGGNATQFVITFRRAHLFGSNTDFITFQIILKPDGNIFIQYNDVETTIPVPNSITNSCSAGIENATNNLGILYRLNGNFGPVFGSPLALQFKPPSSVPVSLVNFSAIRLNRNNKITWTTNLENNTHHFVVERSADGRRFSEIGSIAAAGNSNRTLYYSFIDNAPLKQLNYYRLRIVDADNSSKFSDTRSVRNNAAEEVTLFPNPFKDVITLNIPSDRTSNFTLILSDMNGRAVLSQAGNLTEGANTIRINTIALPRGTFILKIQTKDDVMLKKVTKL